MNTQNNLRSLAAQALQRVVEKGESLNTVLPSLQKSLHARDSALLQELCFGVLRTLPQMEALISRLIKRPLKRKHRVLHFLILTGLYQLTAMRIPPHAVLAETVAGATILRREQFKGMVNGVLRQFQRQQDELITSLNMEDLNYLHPEWLLRRLQIAWPENWQLIVVANNQRPPMWLRVNRQHHSRDGWLKLLEESGKAAFPHPLEPDALRLATPCAVGQLPGFDHGWVSIQDVSAQACVRFLEPQNGDTILDICAAPGGKTTHILEVAPQARVIAVDSDPRRLKRVTENLQRLGMQTEVLEGDARTPEVWCNELQFDRILVDAPCSSTGVIRRHPDIKWLRHDNDIAALAALQAEILDAIWPYLKTGGILLYATCSILPEENHNQIERFLAQHSDAGLITSNASDQPVQIFPDTEGGDGFFYAKLIKR